MLVGDAGFCNYLYQGQSLDVETGLAYNRFRYYDPEQGNYISQDPIGLAGNNPTFYGYVKDTNSWIDLFGLNCQPRDKKGRFMEKGADDSMPGKDYEKFVENKLRDNPRVEVIGTQVTVHTPDGIRYVDVLIRNKETGKLVAVEVKSGDATRNASQVLKDSHISSGEGVFGASAPGGLAGTQTTDVITTVKQVKPWEIP